MRTGLTRCGYWLLKSDLGRDRLASIQEELTMQPETHGGISLPGAPPVTFPLYRESVNKLYVPKFFGLHRFGAPTEGCALSDGEPLAFSGEFNGTLRGEQQAPVNAFLDAAGDPMRMGGILSLPCGFGKTVIALYILRALGRRTLIIVHKDFLLHQWRDRIASFLPGISIGLVKAKKLDVEGKDVVIASLQSLSMKEYSDDVFQGIGFLIIDECHRVGTEVFSRALHKTNFRYTLGISATVERKDGMTKAFVAFLGDVLFRGCRKDSMVRVRQYHYRNREPAYCKQETIHMAEGQTTPNISRMINNIAAFQPRTAFIVDTIVEVLASDDGRRVLVLSDRKNHLRDILNGLQQAGVTAGFYWGGMKPEALAESETRQVMCATYAYAAEGMDVPHLDTLLLATPKSDVEQSCGRILRGTHSAGRHGYEPLVMDVVDCFSLFHAQAKKREKFYCRQGYIISGDGDAPDPRGGEGEVPTASDPFQECLL